MQYGFYINQKAIVEISKDTGVKLDLKDAVLIEFIAQYTRIPSTEFIIVNEKPHYWVAYKKILEECPLLEIESKETLGRRLLNISKAKILDKYYTGGEYKKTYFAFGDNYKRLIAHLSHADSNSGMDESKTKTSHYHADSKVEAMPTQKSDNQYTKISNNNNKEEYSKFENFELDDLRKSLWMKKGYTEDGLLRHTLNWRDYINTLEKTPQSLSSSLDNYLSTNLAQFLKEEASLENVGKADELAKQRIKDYHAQKQENISKVGTDTAPKFQKKEIFKPYYRDYNTRQAYEEAMQDARWKGMIVEPELLPYNVAEYWGETSEYAWNIQPSTPKPVLRATTDNDVVDEDKRKAELIRQFNSL